MVVEMAAAKVVYTLREDKKDLQKQFGCMNGLFQLFDRRYLLGLHRHGRNQKMLTPGEGGNDENGFKNSSEKVKEKSTKRVTIESSRNSCSSSCSSTTFSSLDCSKRVHMELHLPSEPTSPKLRKNQPEHSLPDFRDVVKSSMTKTIRVASVKNVKNEMKHIDSPRPFVAQKSVEFDRKDRNFVKEGKEMSRFSCDEKESKYSLKSTLKVKEGPRFSLDSKQNSKNALDQTQEPGSNKRPSSGVVARLMGLEGFTFQDSIVEVETLKIKKPILDQELVSRFKKMEGPIRVKNGSSSVYGEMEKRLSGIEFKASGKDLRALKQILEAIKNKEQSLDIHKKVKPVSVVVKGTRCEPVKREVKLAKLTKVNHGENTNNSFEKKKVKDLTPRKKKVAQRLVPEKLTGERPVLKKSTKRSTDLTRIKKQSNNKNPKPKMKSNEESCVETRNDQLKEDHKVIENDFVERFMEEKSTVDLPKLTIEQPSPVSVLDAFYTEDKTPSPIKKKLTDFNDYETSHFDENHEMEWNYEGIYADDYSNCFNSINKDHKYISEILLTSGFLKDLESAIRIVQIHPTGSLIKSELFHFLEKKERYEKNEKSKRKLIFDCVNEILLHKLVIQGSFGMWSGKRKGGLLMNGEKLLKELCSEIDNLQTTPERCVYDEDDEVKNLVSVDVNKSEEWDKLNEVPGVVLDIERLIFKDLIDEVVNADVAQNRPGRRYR